MYIILLWFSDRKAEAAASMQGHLQWIQRGLDDGVFLVIGSLKPDQGGAIMAHGTCREHLRQRVDEDPLVAENVVTAEILEIAPSMTDPRLALLFG